MKKNCFGIIKSRLVTEKALLLQRLKEMESNPSLKRFKAAKYVFVVDKSASKIEIKTAVEEIYSSRQIKVVDVNTINVKPKFRRVRGRRGKTTAFKKAIVTLQEGDTLDDV
jgi:large subunit ribosomal protein L23